MAPKRTVTVTSFSLVHGVSLAGSFLCLEFRQTCLIKLNWDTIGMKFLFAMVTKKDVTVWACEKTFLFIKATVNNHLAFALINSQTEKSPNPNLRTNVDTTVMIFVDIQDNATSCVPYKFLKHATGQQQTNRQHQHNTGIANSGKCDIVILETIVGRILKKSSIIFISTYLVYNFHFNLIS